MKVVVQSLFLEENLRTIKLASLYCDNLILPDNKAGYAINVEGTSGELLELSEFSAGTEVYFSVMAEWETIPEEIKGELSLLIQEEILVITDKTKSKKTGIFMETFDDIKNRLFVRNPIDGHLTNRFDELGIVALGESPCVAVDMEELEKYPHRPYYLVKDYFADLAEVTLLTSIQHGSPIVTDSLVVNELFMNYLAKERLAERYNVSKQKTAFLAQQVLREFLPNIKDAPVNEILEVRYKMRDELEAFRVAMSKLTSDIESNPWNEDIKLEVEKIIDTKIKPSVYELKNALTYSKHKAIQKVFENLKEPTTYVPLIGTVLSGISPSIALLSSMGLAGFKAIYDTYIENRTAKDASGLVFLLNAPAKVNRRRGSWW